MPFLRGVIASSWKKAASFIWTSVGLPSPISVTNLVYGNGRFVGTSNGNTSAISTDGVSWFVYTLPTPSGTGFWGAGAFGNGVFCITTSNSGNNSATSTDGQTWTMVTIPGANAFWTGVAFNGTVFCAKDSNSTDTITSTDGATWTRHTGANVMAASAIASNGSGQFVTVGQIGQSAYSTDGISWSSGSGLNGSFNYSSVIWMGTKYLAFSGPGGSSGTYAATSTNGTSWTAVTMPTSTLWQAAAWSGTQVCAIGGANSTLSNIVYTSPDATTGSWTARSFTATNYWDAIAWGSGVFTAMAAIYSNLCNTSPMG